MPKEPTKNQYHLFTGGQRAGRIKAIADLLSVYPEKTLLIGTLSAMDAFIACGIQPSRIMLTSELSNNSIIKTRGLDPEDAYRDIPAWEWECNYVRCDHGMGLAGRDACPGDPREYHCQEFTTEFSDYTGDDERGGDNE